MDTRWWPIREERYCESSKSLEGNVVGNNTRWEGLEDNHGNDRVQWCSLLTSFKEGLHWKLFFQGKKFFQNSCKQDGELNYSRYCQLSLLGQ